MNAPAPQNLTQIQYRTSRLAFDLCDGHARHALDEATKEALREIAAATLRASRPTIEGVERTFLATLAARSGQPYHAYPSHICYSASVAIDISAKYLALTRCRTGVILPTIDVVPTLLARNGVETVPVPEGRLMPAADTDFLDSLQLDALFLVTPNNPTGSGLEHAELLRLFHWAAEKDVVLVLDLSFRLLDGGVHGDLLGTADAMGAQLITVDDTGKVLSLFGAKTGVLASTLSLGRALGQLHSELLLGVSNLDLRFLTALLKPARPAPDEISTARELARTNRSYLHGALSAVDPLGAPSAGRPDSRMSVEWVRVGDRQPAIVRACWDSGLGILPGDGFYWAGDAGEGAGYIRLALLRDPEYFRQSADIFAKAMANNRPAWERR